MKNKIISIVLCVLLVFGILPLTAGAAEKSDDIVILYENDVHCEIEGYSKLAAMKNELLATHSYVGVVSGGDFIQGNSYGAVSRGEYIVNLMNLVGYDAVALGNHEFDYHIPRLIELVDMMDMKPVCCNFQKIGEDGSYFEPYTIVSYGDVDIAYIGITTPTTISSSAPTQYKDENGNYIYTFNPDTLYDIVQSNIDSAKQAGAEYVIAVSHVGYADDAIYGDLTDVEDLIRNTDGFDVVLDAHSHSVIESMTVVDKGGDEVILTSTGTKFENIGKLTISSDGIKTELIKTSDYTNTDPVVDAYIQTVKDEYSVLGDRKVATSEHNLIIQDEDGNRLVRLNETNLGNFCADAFRYAMDADIGFINGAGMRAGIAAGEVTFNHLMNVLPFSNTVAMAEVSGQAIKDMMEMAMRVWPQEASAFPHVSGITFSVNTSIPSSVVIDEYEDFCYVSGQYRVYDIKVYNKDTGVYEPLDLEATYTIAATNYYITEYGSGMSMLKDAKVLKNDGMLEVEALESYINDELGGVIGDKYATVTKHITFTDGEIVDAPADDNQNTEEPDGETPPKEDNTVGEIIMWTLIGLALVCAVSTAVIISIKKKKL